MQRTVIGAPPGSPFPMDSPPRASPRASPCRFCLGPLTPVEAGVCSRPVCRTRLAVEAGGIAARARQQRDAEARRRARERALPILQNMARRSGLADLASVASTPVPHLAREVVPLSAERKDAFAAHLAAIVARAFEEPEPAADAASGRFARRLREVPEDPPALASTCMACQGCCCLRGAVTHAFLTPESVAFHRLHHPGITPAKVLEDYVSLLPDEHVQGSCVYHGSRGCVLPRTQRAGICNEWQCFDRLDLEAQLKASGGGVSLVVALPEHPGHQAPRSVAVLATGEVIFRDEEEAADISRERLERER